MAWFALRAVLHGSDGNAHRSTWRASLVVVAAGRCTYNAMRSEHVRTRALAATRAPVLATFTSRKPVFDGAVGTQKPWWLISVAVTAARTVPPTASRYSLLPPYTVFRLRRSFTRRRRRRQQYDVLRVLTCRPCCCVLTNLHGCSCTPAISTGEKKNY